MRNYPGVVGMVKPMRVQGAVRGGASGSSA
jgi:hypothetical protein